jgi:hypothetical protein
MQLEPLSLLHKALGSIPSTEREREREREIERERDREDRETERD